MRAHSVLLSLGVATGLALVCTPALAAPNAADAKVRVHVDTDFFGVSHYNPDRAPTSGNYNVVGFGIGRPTFIDSGSFVLVDRPVLAFGVAGVLADGHAVLGARAAFTVDGRLRDDDNDTTVSGRLVPYFNWIFNPESRFQGYVGGRVGFGGAAITFEDLDDGSRSRVNSIYPIVGVQGGMHIFVVDRVSLDPGLSFDYAAPHSRATFIDPEPPPDTPRDDYDKDGDAVNFAVTFGLSAWF